MNQCLPGTIPVHHLIGQLETNDFSEAVKRYPSATYNHPPTAIREAMESLPRPVGDALEENYSLISAINHKFTIL